MRAHNIKPSVIERHTDCSFCGLRTWAYKFDELRNAGWRFAYSSRWEQDPHRIILFVCPDCCTQLYDLWQTYVVPA